MRKLYEAGDIITFVREYEDIQVNTKHIVDKTTLMRNNFQYLDHQLTTSHKQAGIIFPPLPNKPATDPAGAESRSKKQLGSR